jgi:hypothetical protein
MHIRATLKGAERRTWFSGPSYTIAEANLHTWGSHVYATLERHDGDERPWAITAALAASMAPMDDGAGLQLLLLLLLLL